MLINHTKIPGSNDSAVNPQRSRRARFLPASKRPWEWKLPQQQCDIAVLWPINEHTSQYIMRLTICIITPVWNYLSNPLSFSSFVSEGGEVQRTLPGSETSHRVSGLHLGERYTFMIRPLFGSISGAEVSITGQTGEVFFYGGMPLPGYPFKRTNNKACMINQPL